MADIRINSLPSTATSFNTDDYIAIDGASGGTRKMLAANPPFSDVTLGTSGPSVKSTLSARAPRQGLVFDGTAGANFTEQNTSTSHTVRFVFNSTFDTTGRRYVAWKSASYGIGVSSSGEGRKLFVEGSIFALGNTSLVAGKNYDCVFVYNGSTVTFYLNGVADGTTAAITTNNISRILETNQSASISGFLIYNRALSASEVVALYEAGAPAGSDYNSASNTSIVTSAFVNGNSGGAYLYDTYSGASATGFTAVKTQTTTEADAYSGNTFSVVKGQQFLVTFTCTLTSGTLPELYLSDWAGSPLYNLASRITAGSFSRVITATQSGSGVRLRFYNPMADQVNYSISNLSITRLGLLLAPDAAQAGGGLTWYDTSGNAANITLPASGVTWNVPTSGKMATSLNVNAAASLFASTSNSTSISDVDTTAAFITKGSGTPRLYFGNENAANRPFLQAGVGGGALFMCIQPYGGNVLLGSLTDSANGKLQLATHTTSAGGIGFGTDIALYRAGGNTLKLELGVSAGVLWFDNGGLGTGGARILGSSGALTVTSNGANSLYLQTGGTTALTLDSSQNATFAGNVTVAASKVFTHNGQNGYALALSTTADRAFKFEGSASGNDYTTSFTNAGAGKHNLSCSGAIAIGNTVNTVSPTSPNRTITMVIGGTTYYIHAKTTND